MKTQILKTLRSQRRSAEVAEEKRRRNCGGCSLGGDACFCAYNRSLGYEENQGAPSLAFSGGFLIFGPRPFDPRAILAGAEY